MTTTNGAGAPQVTANGSVQHDLSGLDGLLGDLDIHTEPGNGDPKAAKLQALFEKAKETYTAKIDTEAHFNPSLLSLTTFKVPSPTELLTERKKKNGSTYQEWTVNWLYTQGKFELCLAYVFSFALSMGLVFPSDVADTNDTENNELSLPIRRTKEEREVSKNWGTIKDIVDAGMRCISVLLRDASSTSMATLQREYATQRTLRVWTPNHQPPADTSYTVESVSLLQISSAFIAFCQREIRLGSGDSQFGYSGMVVPSPDSKYGFRLHTDRIKTQNWTVSYGLALTMANLALELGFYKIAVDTYTLFLGARGQMWRVLLALARALDCYSQNLVQDGVQDADVLDALAVVTKASLVSALQTCPKPRKLEIAKLVLNGNIVPKSFLSSETSNRFEDEDHLLFQGLLKPVITRPAAGNQKQKVMLEEIAVCLTKIIFSKKGGVMAIHDKFEVYVRGYRKRLGGDQEVDVDDVDVEEDNDLETGDRTGPRSVRTL